MVESASSDAFVRACLQDAELAYTYTKTFSNTDWITQDDRVRLDHYNILTSHNPPEVKAIHTVMTIDGHDYKITPTVLAILGHRTDVPELAEFHDDYGSKTFLDAVAYAIQFEAGKIGDSQAVAALRLDHAEGIFIIASMNAIVIDHKTDDPYFDELRTAMVG